MLHPENPQTLRHNRQINTANPRQMAHPFPPIGSLNFLLPRALPPRRCPLRRRPQPPLQSEADIPAGGRDPG